MNIFTSYDQTVIERQLDGLKERLPLHGVPFAVKDNILTEDYPTSNGTPALLAAASMQKYRLSQIRAYLEYNLNTPGLNAEQVSMHFDVSRRYIDKLFSLTGETLSGWIKKRRLEMCCRLLRDEDTRTRSITEIAYFTGFGDISYFNRSFKQNYHITPSQYRKRFRM